MNADLIWQNQVENDDSVKEFTKSFENKKDDVIKVVPSGFNAEINSSNVKIKRKDYIYLKITLNNF